MSIMYHGIRHTQNYSAHQVKRTGESCFGMQDVCDDIFCLVYRVIDPSMTLESRYLQQCSLKVSPVQTSYSPDGRALLYASAGHQLFFMTLGKEGDETKEQWHTSDKDAVRVSTLNLFPSLLLPTVWYICS
jgi:hypothetical protein